MKRIPSLSLHQIIGVVVSCISLSIIVGWVFNIDALKSLFPNLVTMKFSTAISFFFSGIMLTFLTHNRKRMSSLSHMIIYIALPLMIALLMFTFFLSRILHISTGIEQIFVEEIGESTVENIPGLPSLPTMIAFILISLIGIFQMSYSNFRYTIERIVGYILCILGITATLGYIFSVPTLYFVIPDISTAIALSTAILFNLLGVGFILSSYHKDAYEH